MLVKEKPQIWTNDPNDSRVLRGYAPLPFGYVEHPCPECGNQNLIGAIITETADEHDPNILCSECQYWFD